MHFMIKHQKVILFQDEKEGEGDTTPTNVIEATDELSPTVDSPSPNVNENSHKATTTFPMTSVATAKVSETPAKVGETEASDVANDNVVLTKPVGRRKKSLVHTQKFSFKTPNNNINKVKTPRLPAEVRANIIRQCTMPSYAVMHTPQDASVSNQDVPRNKKVRK